MNKPLPAKFLLIQSFLLQTASEKRELMEKKLRAKLEIEVKELRQGNEMSHSDNTADNHENFEQLRAQMNNYEEKVRRYFNPF